MSPSVRNLLVAGGVVLAGCGLIVGDPHGTRVFDANDASTADALGAPDHGAPDASNMDALGDGEGRDTSGPDVVVVADSGALDGPDMDGVAVVDGAPDASDGGCPGSAGPAGIAIAIDGGAPFCVDSTEVTNAEYAAFLASGFTLPSAAVPAGCTAVTSYTPSASWPSPYTRLPVISVNWCQAYAYCAWAGKRLCGEIGGGPAPPTDLANPSVSQWFYACSAGGTLAYPYGNTFDVTVCGGNRTTAIANVGTPAQCVGGFPGLYNMSGNVWEWTDSCDSTAATSFCLAMGGAFDGTDTDNACNGNRRWTRTSDAQNIGFRCCSAP